jgi:DNA-binding XRE family transcriptional regulator
MGKLYPSLGKMVDDRNSNSNPNLPSLKQVRERLGMTQEEFASELGITAKRLAIMKEAHINLSFL